MHPFLQNPFNVSLSTRLSSLGVALLLVNLLALLAPYHWLADLFTHFRYQYLGTAILLLILTLASKALRKKSALLTPATLIALLFYNGLLTFQTTFQKKSSTSPSSPATQQASYTLFSQNVLTSNPHHQQIIAEITAHDPDFLWLTEVSPTLLKSLQPLAPHYPHRHSNPQKHSFGNLLWSKHPLTSHREIVPQHLDHFTLQLPQQHLHLYGIHPLPPISKRATQERNHVIAQIKPSSNTPTLICGDFNATPWSHPLKTLITKHPTLHYANQGQLPHATWNSLPLLTSIPIDHTLHSPEIQILHHQIGPPSGSDHRPLITTFVLSQNKNKK